MFQLPLRISFDLSASAIRELAAAIREVLTRRGRVIGNGKRLVDLIDGASKGLAKDERDPFRDAKLQVIRHVVAQVTEPSAVTRTIRISEVTIGTRPALAEDTSREPSEETRDASEEKVREAS